MMQDCSAPARESQVPAARRELIDAISLLAEKIKSIEGRFGSVLMPSSPQPISPSQLNGKSPELRVEVAEFLMNQTREVRQLIGYTQNLIDRCEL